MRFHAGNHALLFNQPFQAAPTDIRDGKLRSGGGLQTVVLGIDGVRIFNQFPAIFRKKLDAFIPHRLLKPSDPVVAMHHIVGAHPAQWFPITDVLLFDNCGNTFDPGYNSWFFDAEKGGGPLYGNAIYSLQLMQYLFDCKVTSWNGLCTKSKSGVENQFSVTMLMENDLLFTNKTSTLVTTSHVGYLYGEKGYVEIPDYWKARKAILHYPDKEPVVLEYPCEYELMYEALHVERCIREHLVESPVMTEAMTLNAIRILNDIRNLWNL